MYSSKMRNDICLNGRLPCVFVWNDKWNTPEWSDARCTRLNWEMNHAWMVRYQMYSSEMRNEIRLNGQVPSSEVRNEIRVNSQMSSSEIRTEVRLNGRVYIHVKWEIKYAWMVSCQVYSSEKWNMPKWPAARCTRLKWEMKYAWMVSRQMYSSEMRNEICLNSKLPDVVIWNEKWNTPEWLDVLVWNEK